MGLFLGSSIIDQRCFDLSSKVNIATDNSEFDKFDDNYSFLCS